MFSSGHDFISKTLSLKVTLSFKNAEVSSHMQSYINAWSDIKMRKGTWYHKPCEKRRKISNIKIHMQTVSLIKCSRTYFSPLEDKEKDKVQVPQRNEMLSIYCIKLILILKFMKLLNY